MASLQLDEANAFDLLWTMSLHSPFQSVSNLFRDKQSDEHAKETGAPLEAAEHEHENGDADEHRLPNVDIAQRGHEQIQCRIRPPLVDEMKETLVHSKVES